MSLHTKKVIIISSVPIHICFFYSSESVIFWGRSVEKQFLLSASAQSGFFIISLSLK